MSPKISLHAMVGAINPKTMRVLAQAENCTLVVLIDSGSTHHNFLDQYTLQKIRLKCNATDTVRVRVANWAVVSSEGRVSDLPFEIQGVEFEADAYVINLVGCDMVLGVT